MTLPAVPNVARVVLEGLIGDRQMVNVIHVELPGDLTQAMADTISNDLSTALAFLVGEINASCQWTGVTVTDLSDSPPVLEFTSSDGFPVTGTGTGGALPPQTAALVKLIGGAGRARRGRLFIGGFDEDASDGILMDASALATLNLFAGAFLAMTHPPTIVSYFLGTDATIPGRRPVPIPRAVPLASTVLSAVPSPAWVTQRRRTKN